MGDDRERPRLSWREIDQRRSSGHRRDEREPRGPAAEARTVEATAQYLKEIDKIFSNEKGGAEGEALARAVRDAHGTAEVDDACRAYRDAIGMPDDPSLLGVFLDANDTSLVVAALEHMLAGHEAGRVEITSGLKAQLRVLAQSFDDHVAGAAEDLLAGR